MSIYLYKGGFSIVRKSGVGSAILHQQKMLRAVKLATTKKWKEATTVQINTVFPVSAFTAWRAKRAGKKVVYYGHSTMEDFKNSFIGSNLMAPLFKKWICACYSLGDIILTPTEYSKGILEGYGIEKKIYSISNGVDTDFFRKDSAAGERFRKRYLLSSKQRVVISVGHLMERKGIIDFFDLARMMPKVKFFWFGGGNDFWVPKKIKQEIRRKPKNVILAGYVEAEQLKEAYCGADAFVFLSHEETEGIVILEALACEIPVIVREIPVYKDWLIKGIQVQKAYSLGSYKEALEWIFDTGAYQMRHRGRRLAKNKSLKKIGEQLQKIYMEEKLG